MKKLTPITFALVLFLFLSTSPFVQAQIDPDVLRQKVDSIFLDLGPTHPGSAILVVKDKKVLLNQGYGLANLEHQIPISSETVFDLASLSKQFTGYAISLLIEQGKIAKEDDIRTYIPELPEFDQPITIGHLLHHTSGLRDWTSTLSLAGRSFEDVISLDHILRMAYSQTALNFDPGDAYAYSNTGYNMLAELVQRVTGESFRSWTAQHIFDPLEMSHTFFLDDHREVISNRAIGYFERGEGQFNRAPNNLTALGSSSLYSTTTDLANWVNHLMYPPAASAPVVKRMLQRDTLNSGSKNSYASGISFSSFRGEDWISHSGSWASFRSYLLMLPAYDLSVVVLNNNDKSAFRIARQVVGFCVPASPKKEEEAPGKTYEEVKLSQEILNDYVGTYKLGKGWYVHLTLEDEQLWTRATNEDKYPMIGQSDSVLLIRAYGDRTMTFHKNEKGEVVHLVYNEMICPKLSDRTSFETEEPQEYVGDYMSEEINTWYKVIFKDGQLHLWSLDNGELKLTPSWKDDYSTTEGYANNVVFKRDEKGAITGLLITQFRSRNQLFRKMKGDR